MKLGDWQKQAQQRLSRAGVESARLDTLVLLENELKHDKSWLLAHDDAVLSASATNRLASGLERRLKREPLAYILGKKEFYGLDFALTPEVLIPRPETEVLVETAIKNVPHRAAVLEIGTGSGCIAVSLKANRADLAITATDVSKTALAVARQNAKTHRADVNFLLSDLFTDIHGRFDVILANLPYVPSGARRMAELEYEPAQALFAGSDGLDYYRDTISQAGKHLKKGGFMVIEASPIQRSKLEALANSVGFKLTSASEYVFIIK